MPSYSTIFVKPNVCIDSRIEVKSLPKSEAHPQTYLRDLYEIVKGLSTGEWVQILNEDTTIPQFLLKSLTKNAPALMKDDVGDLVAITEPETFPYKDDIVARLPRNRQICKSQ